MSLAGSSGCYYDIDALMAEETQVPCVFECGCRGVGPALDPSSGAEDVKARAAVDLPLWLLQPLTSRNMLTIKLPKWYGEKMRRKIQAGAGVENLRLRCPYFYDVAVLLRGIDRAPAVDKLVNDTFQMRYKEILTKAHSNESVREMARLESLMTVEEARLFSAGRKSVDALNRWRFGGRTLAPKASLKRRLESAQ